MINKRLNITVFAMCFALLLQGCNGNVTDATDTSASLETTISAEIDSRMAAVKDEISSMIQSDSYNAIYVAAGDVNSDGNCEIFVSYGSSTYEWFSKTQIFVVNENGNLVSAPECDKLLISPVSASCTEEQVQQIQYVRSADGEYFCVFNKDNRVSGVEELIYFENDKYQMEEIASFYIYATDSEDAADGYQLYIEDENSDEMPIDDLSVIENKYIDSVEQRTIANLVWERYDKDDDLTLLLSMSLDKFTTEENASISVTDYVDLAFDSEEYPADDELTDEEKEVLKRIAELKGQGY